MLLFIAALKSKQVAGNWPKTCKLFEAFLRSAYNQIDPDFRILVVCHEKPVLKGQYDDRITFIQVDFDAPKAGDIKNMMRDKGKKMQLGMLKAAEIKPDFIMFCDADDLLSRRLSQYANSHKDSNGWIFRQGYRWHYKRKWIYFDRKKYDCGTNSIINSRCIKFPEDMSDESARQCIRLAHPHTKIAQALQEAGMPLEKLPFPGAIYVCDHGSNAQDMINGVDKPWKGWKHLIKSFLQLSYRPITRKLMNEFSVTKEYMVGS